MGIGEIMAAIAAGAGLLSVFVEVSKIKINPWSSLFKWIGRNMTEEVKEELKEVKKEQERILEKQDALARQRAIDAADAIKAEVFRFYNECKKRERHSEAEFNHIIQQNKKYEGLVEWLKEPNGVYEMEYKYIMDIYAKCQKENDFL